MTSMLFNVIVEHAITSLALQFNVFLDVQKLLVDRINFDAPLEWIELRLQDLVLLGLFK